MLEFIKNQGVSITKDGLFNKVILMKDWQTIWLTFAAYALIIAIVFGTLDNHEHGDGHL